MNNQIGQMDYQIYERDLYGEGRWIVAYGFEDSVTGAVYEIWTDENGAEKVVENASE